jgi:phosphoglycolate phosphatase-like HAD superfamily hydrolase
VGDAVSDMLAARAAGVAAVGVTWGAFSYDGLAAVEPDAIATTPAELAAILSADG